MTTTFNEVGVQQKRREYAEGLRDIADWIESTDTNIDQLLFTGQNFDLFTYDKETFDAQSSALGGFREKVVQGSYAITRRRFGPHKVEVNIYRDKVCERVQVGEKVIPAQEATEERIEPVYEWRCEGFTVTT